MYVLRREAWIHLIAKNDFEAFRLRQRKSRELLHVSLSTAAVMASSVLERPSSDSSAG